MDIIVGEHWTEIKVVGQFYCKRSLYSCLPALHLATVFVVITTVIADTPESRWKGKEIHGIFETVFVLRKDICATNTEEIKSHGGDIAKQRHIGWW